MVKATTQRPPMDSRSSEADKKQLELARAQGDAYGNALKHMTDVVADDGGERLAGHFRIGYAVEKAEGMYEWTGSELEWKDPATENLHVEVAVRDASDGRFVPDVRVTVTLIDPDGHEVGTHEQAMMWHPMLWHYGQNWTVPVDGTYRMKVHVEPPTFMRHDEINGIRFTDAVDVEFDNVKVTRGQG